ncbi:MAG TPA: tetratricopeptide repeat protein [Gemmatimonadaceae bacterium]|nr:tetratricopeptide repeat protein [Gemmatimonadaceae bacterium]
MRRTLLTALVLAAIVPARALAQNDVVARATATAPDPVREAAIARLQGFLARYPNSQLRPSALFELGELLVRRADETFAEAQRAGAGRADVPERPDYGEAIARYEELVRGYPDFEHIDAAAYTLGTLDFAMERYADAADMFELVGEHTGSPFLAEALFRLGDTRFEEASLARGNERRQLFGDAAAAYQRAVASAPPGGDIYFLSLYKLGWAYYSQATRDNPDAYSQAVDVFGRLVTEYDRLSPEEQARLGLRGEAIDYMAVAFTQIGGAEAANRYFASRDNPPLKLTVLRRMAASLRDQGELERAVAAYQAVIASAPTDSGALVAQQQVVDIYQNRLLLPEQAQRARIQLVESYGPESPWGVANPSLVPEANRVREEALRQSAQYALAGAQKSRSAQNYGEAAALYQQYMQNFASADSARNANFLFAEALFGERDYARAGVEYSRTAYGYQGDSPLAPQAAQNAIVAFDSALAHAPSDVAVQDSLFAVVDRYVAAYPQRDVARKALIEKGRRASEAARWDVMAATFRTYAEKYPDDPYTPTAQKLVGDALFRQDKYAEAQAQWETAQQVASRSGRRTLADSISVLRAAAASSYADTLVRRGDYRGAAEEVYVSFADRNPQSERAPDALRDAIETYMLADSAARRRGDTAASSAARTRAVELANRLVTTYPSYRFRVQYESLAAQLLAGLGRRDEAIQAWQHLIETEPTWPGRADAMVRVAVVLDSLGRGRDAAAAYEQFSAAYPKDARAADAQYNAAVTFVTAGDTAAALRAYATFAQRFPRDARAAQVQQSRVALLRASGDSAALETELARVCTSPPAAMRTTCAERTGAREFRAGVALWPQYRAQQLVFTTRAQLTRAGVARASARKQELLRQMTTHFTAAIESGAPEWLSGATYYVGLAQWEYGNFLRNATLPSELTDAQREAAQRGADQQAASFDQAAKTAWQSLVDKAQQGGFDNAWVQAARSALQGNVLMPDGTTPPVIPAAAPTTPRDSIPNDTTRRDSIPRDTTRTGTTRADSVRRDSVSGHAPSRGGDL